MNIVKAKPPLHTKPSFIGGAINAIHIFHTAIFDLQAYLTADPTEGAYTINFAVKILAISNLIVVCHSGGHQRTRWASLHTFATSYTAALTHWIGHIKGRVSIMTAARHADHIIHLNFTAGPHAQAALDARIQID